MIIAYYNGTHNNIILCIFCPALLEPRSFPFFLLAQRVLLSDLLPMCISWNPFSLAFSIPMAIAVCNRFASSSICCYLFLLRVLLIEKVNKCDVEVFLFVMNSLAFQLFYIIAHRDHRCCSWKFLSSHLRQKSKSPALFLFLSPRNSHSLVSLLPM
jgi:hypothetical protein